MKRHIIDKDNSGWTGSDFYRSVCGTSIYLLSVGDRTVADDRDLTTTPLGEICTECLAVVRPRMHRSLELAAANLAHIGADQ